MKSDQQHRAKNTEMENKIYDTAFVSASSWRTLIGELTTESENSQLTNRQILDFV